MSLENIVDEKLFMDVLHRERRRVERGDHALGFLRVSAQVDEVDASVTWRNIADGLAATKRDTDVVGWCETGHSVGVIFSDITTAAPALAESLDARMRRELASRLHPAVFDKLTTRFDFYPGEKASAHQATVVNRLPVPVRPGTKRAILHDSIKRAIDVIGSACLLLILAPAMLLTAVMIKLKSPGPVFFRQVRVGRMMKPFTMLKFRTMHVNADSALHHQFVSNFIKSKIDTQESGAKPVFKITSDPRVTSIGRFLRKTSIDELPQLLNVLRGDMSLVGPRPPLHYEVEQYRLWHCRRILEAKPGLTGLWQVAGRSRTTFDDMVRLDLRYARTRSLWIDLKILLATPAAVIAGKGAV
jgi:lipopolysaccharide/colanic/teichoic acid biosynthesis glycosyltransferase